jgi:hypothetical protein
MHGERSLMVDREQATGSRYKVESRELLRGHRGLATQLELVDRELERCTDPVRRDRLHAEQLRITELLADTQARLRACWDRCHINARRT